MGRYWEAVKSGVAREAQDKRPRLNRDELEFQAAAVEILETPASPAARIFAALIMLFAAGALGWAWFGHVDTHAVLQGKLIPIGKVQVIESLINGTVKAIHVTAGDHIAAGDLLVELDPAEYAAERQKLAGSLASAEVSAARLTAIVDVVARKVPALEAEFTAPPGAPAALVELQHLQMRQSLAAYYAEQASLEADIAQKQVEIHRGRKTLVERRKLVGLTGDRLSIFTELEKRGVGIKSQTIDARQGEQDQLMAMVAEEGRIAELKAAVEALSTRKRERHEAYLDRVVTELIEIDRNIGVLQQDLAKAELFERASLLKSPVAGRVQQLEINTLGEVVQTGQQLMVLVPDGTALEIEALLLNKDKGFVREGQEVRVKVEAFPFTRHGTLGGEVVAVSNDAVPLGAPASAGISGATQGTAGPLVFPVRIVLAQVSIRSDSEDIPLTPGMSVTAEIKTGSRSILEFLLDPLVEMADEAFHER
jgi:hemolysin D